MSLLMQAALFETYGPRLDLPALAKVLGIEAKTVRNRASSGTLGIHTYLDGGKRWADVRDVAAYFDAQREKAAA